MELKQVGKLMSSQSPSPNEKSKSLSSLTILYGQILIKTIVYGWNFFMFLAFTQNDVKHLLPLNEPSNAIFWILGRTNEDPNIIQKVLRQQRS